MPNDPFKREHMCAAADAVTKSDFLLSEKPAGACLNVFGST